MEDFKTYRQIKSLPTIQGLDLEYAVTLEEQQKGLMFRKHLPKNKGMLFIYQKPGVYTFWMKNTFIPLDIIFIDSDGKVLSKETMQPHSLDRVRSPNNTKYALEVNEGFSNKFCIGCCLFV